MGSKNTSDNIEAYIKEILAQAGIVELKRKASVVAVGISVLVK